MTVKEVRTAKGIEELRIRALQIAIGEIFQQADIDTALMWNILVNMLCGLSVESGVDKDDVMAAVSKVYDLQSLHMSELDKSKPN
jgi:hypothetical protein